MDTQTHTHIFYMNTNILCLLEVLHFCLSFGICLLGIPIRSLLSDEDCGVLKEPLNFGAETCENRLPFICMKNNKEDNTSAGQRLFSRTVFLLFFLSFSAQSPFLSFQQSGRSISPRFVKRVGLGGKDSVINSTVQQSQDCPSMKLRTCVRLTNLSLSACTV